MPTALQEDGAAAVGMERNGEQWCRGAGVQVALPKGSWGPGDASCCGAPLSSCGGRGYLGTRHPGGSYIASTGSAGAVMQLGAAAGCEQEMAEAAQV